MTPTPWVEQRGESSPLVTVFERPDKDFTVWLRWRAGRKKHLRMSTVRTVRDDRGRILASRQKKAQAEADEKWQELHGRTSRKDEGPVTFARGVTLAFSPQGHYPLEHDRHTNRCRRYLEEAGKIMGHPDWADITPGKVRSIWRAMRARYPDGAGYRKAEAIVATLYAVAGWLQGEFPSQTFPRPLHGWRAELHEYWRRTGSPIQPRQPRHAPDEVARILRVHRQADPRVSLAISLGLELRGGQVVNAMRSHYSRDRGIRCRSGALGELRVPFTSSRKRAPVLWLNWRERAALERALRHGYLADYEAAYQAGTIEDYPLFPAGRLVKGRARLREHARPARPETLIEWFHDLERLAGVTPEKGRGWHGTRRALSDAYETATGDERVKDQLGGWAPGSDMRRRVYQQHEAEGVLEQASHVRQQARPKVEAAP